MSQLRYCELVKKPTGGLVVDIVALEREFSQIGGFVDWREGLASDSVTCAIQLP